MLNNKKILLASGIFPPDIGGPATYAETLYRELPKFGCQVKIVTYSDAETLDNEPGIYRINRKKNIFFRYFSYFYQVWKLAGWADIIYVQGPISEGLPSWLACRLRGQPYILKIVGDYAWEQGRQRFGVKDLLDDFQNKKYSWQVELMRYLQKLVARGAKKIITPSRYLKNIITKWGVREEKITVIYNSVRQPDILFLKEEAKKKLYLNGNLIISVGRLVPWKGFDTLIEIMPDLLKVDPQYKLIIVGDGPGKEYLKTKIKNLGLESEVMLFDAMAQTKLWEYMRAADMFVLNTGYEGLPHIIIEAMQLGLPVIATKVGGNPEVIEHNKTGILVEYNNKKQLEDAIVFISCEKEKADIMAVSAKNSLNKFNEEAMLENVAINFKKIYEDIKF